MNHPRIPPFLKEAASVFAAAGKEAYLVGGAVRDLCMGRRAVDWDLATNALPAEVCALFPRVIPSGIKHGTVTVLFRGHSIEVTTFRTESGYSDGRRPDNVSYAATIEEDLSRRDFTMNAMAIPLSGGRAGIVDPFGGRDDIGRRRIRCVGRAEERFAEDGLRPLRAVRFAAQLDFEPDASLLAAIPPALPVTAKVSPERARDEIDKIIASPRPRAGFLLMEETGLLRLLLPELAACRGVEQKGYHRFDVLDHSLFALDYAAQKGFSREVRLAALFHDAGKPAARNYDGERGVWTFYNHEKESARIAEEIMRRFRYSNAVREKTLRLVAAHMFHYEEAWKGGAVRRFVMRCGEDLLPELFDLRRADTAGTAGLEADPRPLALFQKRIETVLARGRALSVRDLAVNGRDLLALGVKPGRNIGIILDELLEAVMEDPSLNKRERLLEIAGNINKRYG